MSDGAASLVRRWWSDDVDHDWSAQHLQSSGLLYSHRIVVGLECLAFGLSALLSLPLINPWVYDSALSWVVSGVIALSSLFLAVIRWTLPWPGAVTSLAFVAYADISVFAVMALYRSVFESMPGLTLLAAVCVYTVVYHGPRVVIAQSAVGLGATLAFAVWAALQATTPLSIVVIRSLVVIPVTVIIPVLLVPLVVVLRRDATGSFRDDMTDLHNRRGMQLRTGELINRGVEFALLLIDIDRFKAINDDYGHAAGDAALVFVAAVMRRLAPSDAVVARIGGDEFAIVLEGDRPAARGLADALHGTIDADSAGGAVRPMTVSIGIATVPCDVSGDGLFTDLDEVLLRADRAMYAAKHDGGARTVQA